ncbi:DedA family protein [Neorhizobium sp. P12A]|uniref:DedA family protein n=1 Tax=Rhizobium/Agrobacterium group TaxID=227290 RepID=UPI00104FEAF0|nr:MULTISPECIES: DedA family protein [Rhizobium/Agrobacterium group]KAA0695553.1 DedA family protein [Neorhizobium sp. P12A]TCR79110.1 membrane protein DedA with SNARE-associated domain [Rhizobium sp. BK376]
MTFLHETTLLIEAFVRDYGLIALFIILYFESFGAPLPGESATIGASVLAIRGDFSIIDVFLVVWVAAVLGDSTGYAIGHFGGQPLLQRYGPLVKLTPERLEKLQDLFKRRGPIIVVGARFVVILRQLNGLVAGSAAMPWRYFAMANIAGAAIWAGVWSFGTYYLGDFFGRHLTSISDVFR